MRTKAQAGFTLLEVVVAFAITALAMVVLIEGVGSGVAAVDQSARYEEALSRARSHLAALDADLDQLEGVHEGDDGGGYHWRLDVQPMTPRRGAATDVTPRLYAVRVSIGWGNGRRARVVSLWSERLGGRR